MFSVEKEIKEDNVLARLKGILDGSVDLLKWIGAPPRRLEVMLSAINHVNSSGIHPWTQYFNLARDRKCAVRFHSCSPAIMIYFNLIPHFACGGKIVSVLAPFFCKRCNLEYDVQIQIDSIEGVQSQVSSQNCVNCRKPAQFADKIKAYFSFMGDWNA